ncbi:MAG: hypothetical protein KF812_06760 [Fimbriimonadaceae bacterium]|nr:hypothetical protein [Fimbriimonadaceae bacterium]
MSDAGRFYNVLRAYVGREWERVKDLDRKLALEELEQASPSSTPRVPTDPPTTKNPLSEEELEAQARKILGVELEDDFSIVRRQFDRLNERSKPENFPDNSPEREVAKQLHARVKWAFTYLSRNVSETTRRFGSLEID